MSDEEWRRSLTTLYVWLESKGFLDNFIRAMEESGRVVYREEMFGHCLETPPSLHRATIGSMDKLMDSLIWWRGLPEGYKFWKRLDERWCKFVRKHHK